MLAMVENWDELAKCGELEDRYGLEGAAMAGVVNLMVQLQEHGIITEAETDGLTFEWGGETIQKLIPLIAHREGIGALLAEGARGAAAKTGKDAEQYAVHMKGVQREPTFTGTALTTGNFGVATNPRGGHGDRAGSPANLAKATREEIKSYYLGIGVPVEAVDRLYQEPQGYNVPRLTKWVEDINTVQLSMGICNKDPISPTMNFETMVNLYEAATGIKTSSTNLLKAGERTWNLQKVFNIRHGWTRKDDIPNTVPPDEPIVMGGQSYGTFNQLLDDYYEERGWDVKSGIPSTEKLRETGLAKLLA